MPCCHADFAAVEGSDRGFTVGMPTFTFGAGVLFFAAVVVLTMLAAESFDPRLIWDASSPQQAGHG